MAWNIEEAISYYRKQGAPGDQSALVSLLTELQQTHGGAIPLHTLKAVAEGLQTKESYLLAVIKRMPRLRLSQGHTLELCAGPNCGKAAALAAFAEKAKKNNPELFDLKFVPCMRMCGKGPNLRWDGQLFHRNTEESLRTLLEQAAAEEGKAFRRAGK